MGTRVGRPQRADWGGHPLRDRLPDWRDHVDDPEVPSFHLKAGLRHHTDHRPHRTGNLATPSAILGSSTDDLGLRSISPQRGVPEPGGSRRAGCLGTASRTPRNVGYLPRHAKSDVHRTHHLPCRTRNLHRLSRSGGDSDWDRSLVSKPDHRKRAAAEGYFRRGVRGLREKGRPVGSPFGTFIAHSRGVHCSMKVMTESLLHSQFPHRSIG